MRLPVQISLLPLFLLIPAGVVIAEETATEQAPEEKKIYRSFTSDGVVEFTDNPKKGGEEIQLETLPTYKQAPLPVSPPTPDRKRLKTLTVKVYKSIQIASPENNSTLRDNTGNVRIATRLNPELNKGLNHKVQYFLDGKLVQTGGVTVTLSNVDRGSHKLQAKVIDANGKVLLESGTVLFHLKRYFKPRASTEPPPAPHPVVLDSNDGV